MAPGLPGDESVDQGRSCPSMARVLKRVFRVAKPEILDLGPLCGPTAVYLADRGARVSVEDFQPPPPTPAPPPGKRAKDVVKTPVRIDQPTGKFDLVLAWEVFDFTPPDRLADVSAEIVRLLVDGGWLFLFSLNDKSPPDSHLRPGRYRQLGEARILRQPMDGAATRRWVHPTRDLERSLSPLEVQGIHLQRDQMREMLALKTPPPAPQEDPVA